MDQPNIQKLFKPQGLEGEEQTLSDLLHECVPQLWNEGIYMYRK